MKYFMLALCSVVILSCQTPARVDAKIQTPEQIKSPQELTVSLMEKCGVNEQIENVPEKTKAEVRECFKRNEPMLGKMSDQVIDEINDIIVVSFNPETIRSILADYIASRLSPDDMLSVIAWLDSSLGQKITHIEKIASTPEAYTEMISSLPLLKISPDYEERLELVHDIDKSVKATDLILDRMLNMQIITLTAMASAFPSMNLPAEEAIRANFEQNRSNISQAISREIALSILYTYRDISKDDLKDYIRFMKTDYGKRYHQVIQDGTNKAYVYCGKKFSDSVVKRISSKTASPVTSSHDSSAQYPQR